MNIRRLHALRGRSVNTSQNSCSQLFWLSRLSAAEIRLAVAYGEAFTRRRWSGSSPSAGVALVWLKQEAALVLPEAALAVPYPPLRR